MPGLSFRLPFMGGKVPTPLSDTPPDPESTSARAGAMTEASRADHAHPRLTSSHSGLVLNASGVLAVTFTRSFTQKPSIVLTPVVPVGETQPTVLAVQSYTGSAGNWTGCTVRGWKAQIVSVSILGVNVNALGGSAAGSEFTLIALQVS